MKVQQISIPTERPPRHNCSEASLSGTTFSELLNGAIAAGQSPEQRPKAAEEPAVSGQPASPEQSTRAEHVEQAEQPYQLDQVDLPAEQASQTVQAEEPAPVVEMPGTNQAELSETPYIPKTEEYLPQPQKPPKDEEEPDPQAVAAMIAPPVIVPQVLTAEEPTGESAIEIPVTQGSSVTQAPPQTAVIEQPVETQAELQIREPVSEYPSGSGIESAQTVVHETESQPASPALAEHPGIIEQEALEQAQSRFDNLIEKASRELQAKQPAQQEAPEAAPEPETPAAVQPRQEQVVRRRTEHQEEQTLSSQTASIAAEEPLLRPEVREPAQMPEAPVQSPAQQLETRLVEHLENQKMEFHMQLNPQELGRVNVRMILEDGKLAVQIAATTEKAVQALKRESDGLMASLRMAGVQTQSITVVQETASADSHMENHHGAAMQNQPHGESGGSQNGGGQNGGRSFTASGDATADADASISATPERLLDTAV